MLNSNRKRIASMMLMAGLATAGASTLVAADRDWDNRNGSAFRQDLRSDYRDVRNDRGQIERLRAEIRQDQRRLDEDIRYGRRSAIANDRRELQRDQHALDALLRMFSTTVGT